MGPESWILTGSHPQSSSKHSYTGLHIRDRVSRRSSVRLTDHHELGEADVADLSLVARGLLTLFHFEVLDQESGTSFQALNVPLLKLVLSVSILMARP